MIEAMRMSCGNHDREHRRVIHREGQKPTSPIRAPFEPTRCMPLRIHLQNFPWLRRVPLYTASRSPFCYVARPQPRARTPAEPSGTMCDRGTHVTDTGPDQHVLALKGYDFWPMTIEHRAMLFEHSVTPKRVYPKTGVGTTSASQTRLSSRAARSAPTPTIQ